MGKSLQCRKSGKGQDGICTRKFDARRGEERRRWRLASEELEASVDAIIRIQRPYLDTKHQ